MPMPLSPWIDLFSLRNKNIRHIQLGECNISFQKITGQNHGSVYNKRQKIVGIKTDHIFLIQFKKNV